MRIIILFLKKFAVYDLIQVSWLGFGCMGLTGAYNLPVSDEVDISRIN
jgi:hypothetical protein